MRKAYVNGTDMIKEKCFFILFSLHKAIHTMSSYRYIQKSKLSSLRVCFEKYYTYITRYNQKV